MPGFAVLGGNNDFAGIDVDIAPEAVFVAEDGERVALGGTGYPAELVCGVPCRFLVPDADGVIVVGFHRDVFRQGEVPPVGAAVFFFVPDIGDEDADDEGREADESNAHLPGGVEDAFEGWFHTIFFFVLLSL